MAAWLPSSNQNLYFLHSSSNKGTNQYFYRRTICFTQASVLILLPAPASPSPHRCGGVQLLCSLPDGDGDGRAFVRLPLVLPGAAPHQHVSVLQLLRSHGRQPGATFAGGETSKGEVKNTSRHTSSSPGPVLQQTCERKRCTS